MSKVLVDTNVLVYAKDSSSIFHNDALALFQRSDDLFLTSKNLAWTLKYKPNGLLIHDFEIAAIALANGINNMATFNRRDFQRISELVLLKFY